MPLSSQREISRVGKKRVYKGGWGVFGGFLGGFWGGWLFLFLFFYAGHAGVSYHRVSTLYRRRRSRETDGTRQGLGAKSLPPSTAGAAPGRTVDGRGLVALHKI
jgi:hypothetical protein